MDNEKMRIIALAKFLDCDKETAGKYLEDGDYLCLTDDEADKKAVEYIEESLWAFNADFILNFAGCNENGAAKALCEMQGKLCESANPLIKAMIQDVSGFADEAIKCDGRGHFLSQYDGNENEQDVKCGKEAETFYIYRCN
jgi:hypothetical protein